jgi:DNA-binding transcriptional LysR family regulator
MPILLGSRIPLASLIQTLAVAEYLSSYRAAQALGTSQCSVSARIRALEEELGILLFNRNTRGVRLTKAGRLFVERVSVGVDHLDHAAKTAGMATSGACGRLRIGIHALIPRSSLRN